MKLFPIRRLAALLLPLLLIPTPAPAGRSDTGTQMDFGVEAAKKGLWREALFRWEKARKASPDDPRILNNLAVACETTGDFQRAEELYKAAIRLDPNNRDIKQNYDLFNGFYKEHKSRSALVPEDKPPDAPTPP